MLAVLLSAGGANAASVSVGKDHACAVLNDGKLMCWGSIGMASSGLGISDGGDSLVTGRAGRTSAPVARRRRCRCGRRHTCAILDDDTLKCWGVTQRPARVRRHHGQERPRGDGGGEPRLRAHGEGFVAREHHTCAILDDDTLKCWGQATATRVRRAPRTGSPRGDGGVNLGSGRTAKALSLGKAHLRDPR